MPGGVCARWQLLRALRRARRYLFPTCCTCIERNLFNSYCKFEDISSGGCHANAVRASGTCVVAVVVLKGERDMSAVCWLSLWLIDQLARPS